MVAIEVLHLIAVSGRVSVIFVWLHRNGQNLRGLGIYQDIFEISMLVI